MNVGEKDKHPEPVAISAYRIKSILRLSVPMLLSLIVAWVLLGWVPAGKITLAQDDPVGSPACNTLTDPMERDMCHFVTAIYPDGLLTNWPNPRLPGHFDHTPMSDYGDNQPAISESASMLALYAALIGDQTTFDYLFDVSAPVELGGTGGAAVGVRFSDDDRNTL